MDWTAGYITDVDYPYGYFPVLQPDLLKLACLSAGIAVPAGDLQNYLEVGFGQGLSVNIHAAANPGVFWGTDFNPNHAAEAIQLAAASGSGARLSDESFAELAAREDLPQFDIIVAHGIWTWVSAANRQIIIDLVRRHLRVGGLFYVSYNCRPGWAAAEPLKHLMSLHAELVASDTGSTANKVEGALQFVQEIVAANALYFKANPTVTERSKKIGDLDRSYVAHEYLAHDWDIMAFSDVAGMLEQAGLTFATTANLLDHFDDISLSAEAQALLAGIQHPILKQSVRDYLVNQQFRRDIFVKGPQPLTPLERAEALQMQGFVLVTPPADVVLQVAGSAGQAALREDIYRPVLAALAENNHQPKSLRRIWRHPGLQSLPFDVISEAILVLTGAGHVSTARLPSAVAQARCQALNRYICTRSRSDARIGNLASPVSGAGVSVSRIEQHFLLALAQGKDSPTEQAVAAWEIMQAGDRWIVQDGKPIDRREDAIAHLAGLAEQFAARRLDILKALGIA
ncbi:MAG: class I SAM-dependent methyltransferase [Reyranellaceae bacterium]